MHIVMLGIRGVPARDGGLRRRSRRSAGPASVSVVRSSSVVGAGDPADVPCVPVDPLDTVASVQQIGADQEGAGSGTSVLGRRHRLVECLPIELSRAPQPTRRQACPGALRENRQVGLRPQLGRHRRGGWLR